MLPKQPRYSRPRPSALPSWFCGPHNVRICSPTVTRRITITDDTYRRVGARLPSAGRPRSAIRATCRSARTRASVTAWLAAEDSLRAPRSRTLPVGVRCPDVPHRGMSAHPRGRATCIIMQPGSGLAGVDGSSWNSSCAREYPPIWRGVSSPSTSSDAERENPGSERGAQPASQANGPGMMVFDGDDPGRKPSHGTSGLCLCLRRLLSRSHHGGEPIPRR